MAKQAKSKLGSLKQLLRHPFKKIWKGPIWRKILVCLIAAILAFLGISYGVAEWYNHKHNHEPFVLGTTFVPDYAKSFGLDPHQTLNAIFSDLGMRHIRLVSYWDDIQPQKDGAYNFKELDSEFALANQYGAKVSLSVGLRQPRWPECHEPGWAKDEPTSVWEPQLYSFMTTVVNRYKDNPALQDYQLENEFFMTVFGTCTNFDRSRLVSEFNMVKALDPSHPIVISRSDNWVGIPVGQPKADEYGISIYKRVWDAPFTHRYFEYPLPPWFYSALAGYEELFSGRNMVIHELQAEAWAPNFQDITQTPLAEQYKSMNAARMETRIQYAKDTGMRSADLWGAEWWYWLKVKKGDPSIWNVVKQNVAEVKTQNLELSLKKD